MIDLTLTEDNTRLKYARFVEAGSYGRTLRFKQQKYLIWHYTAGSSLDATVKHFQDPANKVSAHLVVGRDGQVVQMVPFDRPAWHAGPDSRWRPKGQLLADAHINFYGLGIELDNYGPLTRVGAQYRTWFGAVVPATEVADVDPKAPGSFGVKYWHAYSAEQLEFARDATAYLMKAFGLVDVLGHSDVLPGQKRDPGPLFPLAHIRAYTTGR